MKKQMFILLLGACMVLSLGSCKKWYSCTCKNGSVVEWTGSVEGTSVANAEHNAQNDLPGDNCTCQ